MHDVLTKAQPSVLPDQLPVPGRLDPVASLAFRTPLGDHPLSADGKAAAILTLLGLMFSIIGRYAGNVGVMIKSQDWHRPAVLALLGCFALCAFAAVLQAFRTITPRFPKVAESLAFFGDIARLSREEYVRRVEGLTAEQALDQILLYNHTASTILVEKFTQLRRGIRFFQFASVLWVVLMALIGWEGLR
jgi:hypothetical protein